MKYVLIVSAMLFAFSAGSWYHQRTYGEVRVFTNILEPGDKYNRGQKTIDISFPKGLQPKYILLPDGQTYPDDSKPRWVEILPGGERKTWLDRLSFEIAESPPATDPPLTIPPHGARQGRCQDRNSIFPRYFQLAVDSIGGSVMP